jgi:phosphoserine phosphatase RsbU/P
MTTELTTDGVLWIGAGAPPAPVAEMIGDDALRQAPPDAPLDDLLGSADLAVLDATLPDLPRRLRQMHSAGIVPIVWGGSLATLPQVDSPDAPCLHLAPDASDDRLRATLETARALAPTLHRMRSAITQAESLAAEASRTADEIDEEMRLASRLQQDFLPRHLPEVGRSRFAVRFHAASWVSGDIYDVARLDETHVGFYVADAVGHGMPAALLTMYIKKALQTKRISGHSYEILSPADALGQLNADLCRQKLSMCEFCTAVYAIVDTAGGQVRVARAGHPPPLIYRADGSREELSLPGSLLGVMDEATFTDGSVRLAPGDRMVVYSDGAEDTICGHGKDKQTTFAELLQPMMDLPTEDLMERISELVPTPWPEDDVTVLLLEMQ